MTPPDARAEDCECDRPEIRDAFKTGKCSEAQILQCHGRSFLEKRQREAEK